MKKLLSIVVPCFNEQEVLPLFYSETKKHVEKLDVNHEFVFIDDGSSDNTLSIIKELAVNDVNIKYLSFSRNFGKESAMYAGLEGSRGDYVVLMDADMQDPPSLLKEMLERLQGGTHDCIASCRQTRKGEPIIRSFFARRFYALMHKISSTQIVPGARDYRMMTRQMVDAVLTMTEYNRFSKGILSWVGFNTYWISYDNVERPLGKTKWNFWGLVLYSIDGITAFSTAPLLISSFGGIILCFVALIMMIYFIVKTLLFGDPVDGYPSLVSIILFLGGIQLLGIGIIGQYLSKTYLEVKRRPIYIKKDSNI